MPVAHVAPTPTPHIGFIRVSATAECEPQKCSHRYLLIDDRAVATPPSHVHAICHRNQSVPVPQGNRRASSQRTAPKLALPARQSALAATEKAVSLLLDRHASGTLRLTQHSPRPPDLRPSPDPRRRRGRRPLADRPILVRDPCHVGARAAATYGSMALTSSCAGSFRSCSALGKKPWARVHQCT
jgi:hypothetical protein